MQWIITTALWYICLLLLGAVSFPLTRKVFSSFFDKGYAFSKTFTILLLSYGIFILSLIKIVPFTQVGLFIILFILLLCNIYIYRKSDNKKIGQELFRLLPIFLIEELLFIVSLYFLTFIRGQEPSLRGLEKFMDFGFMNSILRSTYFPPIDIWLSGDSTHSFFPINYYYFGHLTGAVLIKLSGIKSNIGYNLILAAIFAQSTTLVFSLVGNIIYTIQKSLKRAVSYTAIVLYGLLGSFIVNLGGNLHTIYVFTSGYPNDSPLPFWQILGSFNPTKYWYPNATRFIPFTIHEFPAYSYVVADLHGHVFDIPFVLVTIALLFVLIINKSQISKLLTTNYSLLTTIFLGFLLAVHYMTNALDGPIYFLLTSVVFAYIYGITPRLLKNLLILGLSFILFVIPFSIYFSPFATGIGVNCSADFLVKLQKIGPFLFEKDHCQLSPLWMMFVLWGFFWINFCILLIIKLFVKLSDRTKTLVAFLFILFSFGTLLLIIPEFFYIKDIYPAHFRANTMFKLGYQAFIIMGMASAAVFYLTHLVHNRYLYIVLRIIFLSAFFLVFIYSFFSFPSYYGKLDRPVNLDGAKWLQQTYPEDAEIVQYLNSHVDGQPTILEAQGDSYTDYERISAYTGLPTVAGWWVHEWLWRGSADIVGSRIPDITNIYESNDVNLTQTLIKKYNIQYIVFSNMERQKYKNLNESKFTQFSTKIFTSSNNSGALYKVN